MNRTIKRGPGRPCSIKPSLAANLLQWKASRTFKSISRISFSLYCPITNKEFNALTFPYLPGDAVKGKIRRYISAIKEYRLVFSGILRREHGFVSDRLQIKVKYN